MECQIYEKKDCKHKREKVVDRKAAFHIRYSVDSIMEIERVKHIIENTNLSWKAKGLYMAIHQCLENGDITKAKLESMSADGASATYAAMKELVSGGYVRRERRRQDGRFKGYNWELKGE